MLEIREPEGGFDVGEAVGARPGDDADVRALRATLARLGVLCLRMPAPLDDEGFQAVARLFGAVKGPVARTEDGGTFRYSEARQIIDAGFVATEEVRAKLAGVAFGGHASVQHKAGGDFSVGEPRRFWRCMIAGERPV
jgi:hypothetical protein